MRVLGQKKLQGAAPNVPPDGLGLTNKDKMFSVCKRNTFWQIFFSFPLLHNLTSHLKKKFENYEFSIRHTFIQLECHAILIQSHLFT